MSDYGEGKDWVWEDDPRLQKWPFYLADGAHIVFVDRDTPEGGHGKILGLLVRSVDSVRFLPVKKRRKPLEQWHGTVWRDHYGPFRVIGDSLYGGWRKQDMGTFSIGGKHRTPESIFGLEPSQDPRDHGWELIEP